MDDDYRTEAMRNFRQQRDFYIIKSSRMVDLISDQLECGVKDLDQYRTLLEGYRSCLDNAGMASHSMVALSHVGQRQASNDND